MHIATKKNVCVVTAFLDLKYTKINLGENKIGEKYKKNTKYYLLNLYSTYSNFKLRIIFTSYNSFLNNFLRGYI